LPIWNLKSIRFLVQFFELCHNVGAPKHALVTNIATSLLQSAVVVQISSKQLRIPVEITVIFVEISEARSSPKAAAAAAAAVVAARTWRAKVKQSLVLWTGPFQ